MQDDATRWQQYGRTLVRVEIEPRRWVLMNGPEAVEGLPHPGPLFVITAWNPGSRFLSGVENRRRQAELEALLEAGGVAGVPAIGEGVDVDHAEVGRALWGIDRAQAVAYGARFEQDAFFEFTDTDTRLVFCRDGRVVTHPRRAPLAA